MPTWRSRSGLRYGCLNFGFLHVSLPVAAQAFQAVEQEKTALAPEDNRWVNAKSPTPKNLPEPRGSCTLDHVGWLAAPRRLFDRGAAGSE